MEDLDDAQLIQQVLAGDDRAFDVLVGRYRAAVFSWVRQALPDARYDEDLAQDVFVEAYYALDTLREHRKFSAWLRQIARNVCISWLRRRRTPESCESLVLDDSLELLSQESVQTPEEQLMVREEFDLLLVRLDLLSEIDQKLIRLYYLEGQSYQTISKMSGISAGAIKSRLHRARVKLKGELSDER